jgi:hypothetical protein
MRIIILLFLLILLTFSCAFIDKEGEADWDKVIALHSTNFKVGTKIKFENEGNNTIISLRNATFIPDIKGFFPVYYDLTLTEKQMNEAGFNRNDMFKLSYPSIFYFSEKNQKLDLSDKDSSNKNKTFLISQKNKKKINSKIDCVLKTLLKPQDYPEPSIEKFTEGILSISPEDQKVLKGVTFLNAEEMKTKCKSEFDIQNDQIKCALGRAIYFNIHFFYTKNYDLPMYECTVK